MALNKTFLLAVRWRTKKIIYHKKTQRKRYFMRDRKPRVYSRYTTLENITKTTLQFLLSSL